MKVFDIRSRMLLAALLPVTLITVLLMVVFLLTGFDDISQAHNQRARSLARQLATASEYGLFSDNITHLQTIASGALREAGVSSVVIVNASGSILVRAGKTSYQTPPRLTREEASKHDAMAGMDLLSQPIIESQIKLDDLFDPNAAGTATRPPVLLGHVLIEFSRENLVQSESDKLKLGLAVAFGGLLFGYVLALRLGRGVVRPILRVSNLIERIGQGELWARADILPGDPLQDLQRGLNQMAQRLEMGREDMEQRIAQATQELRDKKEEAETATLAKSRFLAAASHDLRQPTHALGLFVARLAQLPHDAQTRHVIDNLEASVRAMQDLLDALLDISRLDANAVQVQQQAFALADIFEPLRYGLSLSAAQQGLRLRVRSSSLWVMSDAALLNRLVLNLVSNAVRYTRSGGVLVAARVLAGGKTARIEVWDSGIGIAPEHHQAIFREFYQVSNSERDRTKGLGLGLNIVQRTAQLLGHRLQLCSRVGQGSRFSIEVPLTTPDVQLPLLTRVGSKQVDDLSDLVVLIIEDDALAREGLVTLFASWGCRVRAAESLSTALAHLGPPAHHSMPDLLVSDYRLRGGENGIETIAQLRVAADHMIPACLMSGDTDPGLMQLAKAASLTLLHKPVRPAKLRSLVRHLVASGRQVQDQDAR
jgi:signal transduction histidine kinase